MKTLKGLNYILIAIFLIMYMMFDDLIPTMIDNGIAGLESLAMLVLAFRTFKNTIKEQSDK